MQSELLTKFYVSYYEWLQEGAPRNKPYSRRWGLCSNLGVFVSENYEIFLNEMTDQFINEKLHGGVPFAIVEGGERYHIETSREECHLNKARIKWIVDHLSTKDIL